MEKKLVWVVIMILAAHPYFCFADGDLKPRSDSGCSEKIKNYHCYCPRSQQPFPTGNNKCENMFDDEVLTTGNGFPTPVVLTWPNVDSDFSDINMRASDICLLDKYCKIQVTPRESRWVIIDWCLTTKHPTYHLQLLGPPHTPVCCEPEDDKKYTMMCMRRDMNLKRIIKPPLQIHLYLKKLPRELIELRLSLVLFDKRSNDGVLPVELADKMFPVGSKASVKLVRVEGLMLDLTKVKKWEDL